jgi:hypothetical protein
MSDLVHASTPQRAKIRSHDLTIIAVYTVFALAMCFVVALYSDPANIAPSDPAAISFYP